MSDTFENPARIWFGVTAELTTSVRYTCTTSFPAIFPVFFRFTVIDNWLEVAFTVAGTRKFELCGSDNDRNAASTN